MVATALKCFSPPPYRTPSTSPRILNLTIPPIITPKISGTMSRDSSATYLHFHSSRLADVFEEFCRPPSSTVFAPPGSTTTQAQQANTANNNPNTNGGTQGNLADGSGMTALPGHYLPFEEIGLPPHLMPINPEDEDDVVPDMHAAFGINRAMGQHAGAAGGGIAGVGSGTAAGGVGASGGAMSSGEPTGKRVMPELRGSRSGGIWA